MYTIKLNGANAEKVADLIGATIIVHNESKDTITVTGGNHSLLNPNQIDFRNTSLTPLREEVYNTLNIISDHFKCYCSENMGMEGDDKRCGICRAKHCVTRLQSVIDRSNI